MPWWIVVMNLMLGNALRWSSEIDTNGISLKRE
jgi:hypothetical protein